MTIKLEHIIGLTAKVCGVTVEQILGCGRSDSVLSARQLAMFVARKNFTFCLSEIGAGFGKTHATVIQAVRIVEKRLKGDKGFREQHERLQEALLPMMPSGRLERTSELVHFHHDSGPLNVRIPGDSNEINLMMHSKGDAMTIVVTMNKEVGK